MKHFAVACLLAGSLAVPVQAGWTEQTLKLVPGWNAIYLELQPDQPACSNIFAGLPVESVWSWNKSFSSIQFVQDPVSLLPKQTEWSSWFPPSHPQSFLSLLPSLRAGEAYLIKMADDSQPVTLTISGRPVLPRLSWYPDSFNLVGFYVDPQNKPSFATFLAPEKALRNQPVFALKPDGHWQQITDLAGTRIEPGQAYWIKCDGHSTFTGPLSVANVFRDGITFADYRTEAVAVLHNHTAASRTVTVRLLSPTGSVAYRPVPLSYWHADFETRRFMWDPLSDVITRELDSGEQWTMRLVVRRPAMLAADASEQFGSILEITDGSGSRLRIPVSAAMLSIAADGSSPLPRNGLWVGRALLDKVSQVNISSTPAPTPAPLSFRLIVHQDASGTTRLLQHVTIMQNMSGGETNLVLVTDDALLSHFGGGNQTADDERIGQRFSSVVFGFDQPLQLTYNQGARTLSRVITIGYNDPLSPFKHLYHPDHNNLENYQTKLPESVESFTVSRDISMTISTNIVAGASAAAWGDTITGGSYSEKLQGLHHKPLFVQGSFLLQFVSDIDSLYDGQ